MSRKIKTMVIAACALVLGTTVASAAGDKFSNPFGFVESPPVPEIDAHGLGSVGIGTLLIAISYGVDKVYRKIKGAKRS